MGAHNFNQIGADECECGGHFESPKKLWERFGERYFSENCEL